MRKMNRIGLLSAAGAGVAALAVGVALPAAAADDRSSWTNETTSVTSAFDGFRTWVEGNVLGSGNDTTAGNVGIDGGLVNAPLVDGPVVSDVANGPVLSGNDTPVLSGNDVTAPVGSGNDTSLEAPVGSGNEVGNGNSTGNGTEVGNGNSTGTGNDVGSGNDTGASLSDIGTQVDGAVGDVSSEVDGMLSGILD